MENYKKHFTQILLATLTLTLSLGAFSQEIETKMLLPGPDGVVMAIGGLFNYKLENKNNNFPTPNEIITIYKSNVKGKKNQKIATISFPASASEMEKKMSPELKTDVLNQLKTDNMQNAYEVIRNYGRDTLGLLIISPELQKILGMLYTDTTWKPGDQVTYHFDRTNELGTQQNLYSESLDGSLPEYSTKFKLSRYNIFEDNVTGEWEAEIVEKEEIPMFAQLYSRKNNEENFTLNTRIFTSQKSTKIASVYHSEDMEPNGNLAWYIRTIDAAGNLGKPSDTLYAINFNKNKIAPIENLKVTDTLNSLLVTWKPLPRKAYYTAIQILKSRKLGEDYVVLDTIAPTKSSFMDKQVIPGSSYFYKVRPLLFDLPGVEPMVFTEVSGYKEVNEELLPSTPQGLQAVNKDGKIELSWLPNPELNIFGYYVLRGTSLNNMKVIDGPIKRHHYTDSTFSKSYSGQYTYALQVLNNGQKMSDTSAAVSVSIRQATILLSPGGVHARRVPEGISLEWENTRIKDNSIIGYILYRREKGEEQYQLLSNKPISLPAYVDSNTLPEKIYEYAVSSIDTWGNQSILSPFVGISANSDDFLKPPSSISLRNLQSGIEVSWAKPYDVSTREYVIYRTTIKNNKFEKIATVNPSTPYVDKSVQGNTLYKYAVSVKGNNTEGLKSTEQLIRRP